MKLTKSEFDNLDFDDKCAVIENIIPMDYYNGQTKINFWISPEQIENPNILIPTPPEIEKVENQKFEELINQLSKKVFQNKEFITLEEFEF